MDMEGTQYRFAFIKWLDGLSPNEYEGMMCVWLIITKNIYTEAI